MTKKESHSPLSKLIETMAILRSTSGCPWDKAQTPETLKPYILEEAYELIEAIDSKDTVDICDELGDLLLQVVFIAQIFNEQNKFGIDEVADSINAKLIRRHPHVFADANSNDHASNWDEIKKQERTSRGKGSKLVDRIPANLPALKKASKVAKKLDCINHEIIIDKLDNILRQLSQTPKQEVEHYVDDSKKLYGDFLFISAQLANSLKLDAEDLLRKKTTEVIAEIDNKMTPH